MNSKFFNIPKYAVTTLLFIYLLLSHLTFAQNNSWPKKQDEIRKVLMKAGRWESSNGVFIEFFNGGKVDFHEESEPVIHGVGTYTVDDKFITINLENAEDERLKGQIHKCSYGFKEHNYLPKQFIRCSIEDIDSSNYEAYNQQSRNPKGIHFELDQIKMITTGLEKVTVNFDSYFRKAPNTKGEIIPFNQLSSEECMEDILSDKGRSGIKQQVRLPKGYKVEAIAKTVETYQIEKWNNHWYYVSTSVGCYGDINTTYGWIFGQFLDFDKK
ncbi:hypothetical protein LEP1GSC060_3473 [Leptospira weilii serovar Ranarum str. ICFT]|uniref:Uncharacterized protein n=1 Tax=Leptospira weilii serovar Ranarum str. ICFT TaxID=1218598 RepID=N1WHS6_9LEPT|nr:hypothetical protein [Leptospira weilii]EMY76882.1 hypothetical protein LEP1GSC060_3473 [Leptospira weilii serovar Ranarum str. ICFT]